MTVPILLDGKECGTLELRRDGAFTLFEARCGRQAELTRLWVFGGGRRGYLGVLQPEGDGLALRRRLSRAAMRSFPDKIEYAGDAPDAARPVRKEPAPEREAGGWILRPDGSLWRAEGAGGLLALPCALRREARGVRVAMINGKTYLLFRC